MSRLVLKLLTLTILALSITLCVKAILAVNDLGPLLRYWHKFHIPKAPGPCPQCRDLYLKLWCSWNLFYIRTNLTAEIRNNTSRYYKSAVFSGEYTCLQRWKYYVVPVGVDGFSYRVFLVSEAPFHIRIGDRVDYVFAVCTPALSEQTITRKIPDVGGETIVIYPEHIILMLADCDWDEHGNRWVCKGYGLGPYATSIFVNCSDCRLAETRPGTHIECRPAAWIDQYVTTSGVIRLDVRKLANRYVRNSLFCSNPYTLNGLPDYTLDFDAEISGYYTLVLSVYAVAVLPNGTVLKLLRPVKDYDISV